MVCCKDQKEKAKQKELPARFGQGPGKRWSRGRKILPDSGSISAYIKFAVENQGARETTISQTCQKHEMNLLS